MSKLTINNFPINYFTFPGGEVQVKIPIITGDLGIIRAELTNSNSIMALMLAVDALRRSNPRMDLELLIPYFPYARQDRVCNFGEALSVSVMANMINSLNFRKVTIYDPHSDVTTALVKNSVIISQSEIIVNSALAGFIKQKKTAFICPDSGARKKIIDLTKRFNSAYNCNPGVFYAEKIRDTMTGEIILTTFDNELNGQNVIIIDDICDGGRTFLELSKVLEDSGAGEIYLYVTHGIFSKGLDCLRPYFKQIFCANYLGKEKLEGDFLSTI